MQKITPYKFIGILIKILLFYADKLSDFILLYNLLKLFNEHHTDWIYALIIFIICLLIERFNSFLSLNSFFIQNINKK